MMIKVCGITRREDALAAVDAGASALGFIFYPGSPRYVTPEEAAELGDQLDVWKVGIFVDEAPAAIGHAIRAAKLDVVQIYGGEAPNARRVWKAFRGTTTLPDGGCSVTSCEAILLDGPQYFSLARGVAGKVIIAGGLDASNVREAMRVAEPWGVDASSRLESAPGIKDHEKVRQFVKAARETS
jgi:phosphoribosylanthranilate isomerase